MRVVVFGGGGFLGSHVADALSNAGHEVLIFDIKPSAYLRADQTSITGDILDEAAVEEAVVGCDAVYNFAGLADIDEAKDRPLDTIRYNVVGNSIILEAVRKHRVQRFLFASSVYVFSQAGSFYRNSKQACELIIESYSKVYDIDYTILRYGSLYGPRSDERNGIYRLLAQAVKDKEIRYTGTGDEIREYIHVLDAARLSVDVLSEDFRNQHVVLTGHQAMKVADLLRMIQEMLGDEVTVEYLPADSKEHYFVTPYSFRPTVGKKVIGNAYLDLGQGLMNTLADIYNETNVAS